MGRNEQDHNNPRMNLKTRQIAFFGGEQAGKTSLLKRYIHDSYDDNTESTVGAGCFFKRIVINNIEIKLQCFDTAGKSRFRNIIKSYYQNADYCIGVFDLTNPSSLEDVREKIQDIRKINPQQKIQLIGTKLDLKDRRKITDAMINDFKERNNIQTHFLVSAKVTTIGQDIGSIFKTLAGALTRTYAIDDTYLPTEYLIYMLNNKIIEMEEDRSSTYNDGQLINSAKLVIYQAYVLLADIKVAKAGSTQERELQTTLRNVYNVLCKPDSKEHVDTLQKNVNISSPGHSVRWKKFAGAILIFLGVAIIGLSIAGIPFTAGLSGSGIAGGALVIAAGGFVYRSGMQSGVAKLGENVVNTAKVNFFQK